MSLTLLAVILGLLAGSLRVISKNWEANAQRIETLDMVARAADILRRDAAGLQRIVASKGRAPRYVFTGTETSLSFVTLEPPYPSAAGPYFVDYSIAHNGPDAELIRARARYQHGLEAFPGATPANRVRLVQGRYRYHFAYADKSAGSGTWRNSWRISTRLPAADPAADLRCAARCARRAAARRRRAGGRRARMPRGKGQAVQRQVGR